MKPSGSLGAVTRVQAWPGVARRAGARGWPRDRRADVADAAPARYHNRGPGEHHAVGQRDRRAAHPAADSPLTGLVDQNGKPVSLTDEKGHVVLLAFMDPLCVNLCPILGRDIVAVEQALPKTIKPVLLIVSVMPDRTAANVAQFIKTNLTTQWDPGWHWLLGPDSTLKITWLKWGEPLEPPKTNYLDVIDPQGYVRVIYPAPLFVSDVTHAITVVAHE